MLPLGGTIRQVANTIDSNNSSTTLCKIHTLDIPFKSQFCLTEPNTLAMKSSPVVNTSTNYSFMPTLLLVSVCSALYSVELATAYTEMDALEDSLGMPFKCLFSIGCMPEMWSNGWCDRECNTVGCEYDGGDCYENGDCSVGCPQGQVGNAVCEKGCNRLECEYDGTDCVDVEPPTGDNVVPQYPSPPLWVRKVQYFFNWIFGWIRLLTPFVVRGYLLLCRSSVLSSTQFRYEHWTFSHYNILYLCIFFIIDVDLPDICSST